MPNNNDLDFYYSQTPKSFISSDTPALPTISDEELLNSDMATLAERRRHRHEMNSVFDEPEEFIPVPSLGETIIEDIVRHPLATAANIATGWTYALADLIGEYLPTNKYLPKTGSPTDFFRHMDEHPEDWLHVLGLPMKLNDMIQNPKDYAE